MAKEQPQNDKKDILYSAIILAVLVLVIILSTVEFRAMREVCTIVEGPGVTGRGRLAEYFKELEESPGDTDIYFMEGAEPGGTVLVMGGLHPNEPAGLLAAVVLIENAVVETGRMIVIPHANASGYTHTESMQASPPHFAIQTEWGERVFRYGSRLSSPLHQYPDPQAYTHPSGMLLSGPEVRNLNRVFPGRPDGLLTEKIAWGIMNLIWDEKVDLVIDIHEARPINPVVNCIMAHPRVIDVASIAIMDLGADWGVPIRLEPSPEGMRGITHREIGDHSDALAVILESPNPAMDALRGPTDAELVVYGKDDFFKRAGEAGLIRVPYIDCQGFPIDRRTGRHTTTVKVLIDTFTEFHFDKPVIVNGIPTKDEIIEKGLGHFFLKP